MLEKTEGAIKNEQSRDTDNIGHTRHRTNKCKRKLKGQSRINNPETQTTGHTRHRTKTNKTKYLSGLYINIFFNLSLRTTN
jgi:hypothetical protein